MITKKLTKKNRKHSTLFLAHGYGNNVNYTVLGSIVYGTIEQLSVGR